jgi:hypothetical protein
VAVRSSLFISSLTSGTIDPRKRRIVMVAEFVRCKHCYAYEKLSYLGGECRLHPPQYNDGHAASFPIVNAGSWCLDIQTDAASKEDVEIRAELTALRQSKLENTVQIEHLTNEVKRMNTMKDFE